MNVVFLQAEHFIVTEKALGLKMFPHLQVWVQFDRSRLGWVKDKLLHQFEFNTNLQYSFKKPFMMH